MSSKMSFDEFVEWIDYSSSTCIHPTPHKNQLDWFTDDRGNILVDFIGKFESLQEDWAMITQKLGIRDTLPHKNQNSSNRKPYPEYYNERTKNIIADKFKVDIEYFGYTFGN